jgi:hypothetical protein
MQKRVFLQQMEIPEGRNVMAYFVMVIEDNGIEVARSKPHLVNFMPDADADAMFDEVNANITTRDDMLWPPIPRAEWDRAVDVCTTVHTPEVKAAYEVWKASLVK